MQTLNIHHCKNLRVSSVYPANGNCLTLAIDHSWQRGNDVFEINLFNLPEEITEKLLSVFPAMRIDRVDEKVLEDEIPS